MKKKKTVWPWIVMAIIAVLAVAGWLGMQRLNQQSATIDYQTYTAARGSVTRSITGSGRLEAMDSESVEAEENIAVETVSVQAGDVVHAGDVLLTYDKASIQDRIDALYEELSSLDQQIMRRTERSAITAPTSGRVKALYAKAGDDLETVMKEYGALALLSSDDKLQVKIASDAELAIGKNVTVTYEGGRQNGTIANVTEDGYLVTLPDGNLPVGKKAEVLDRDVKLGEGTLEIHAPIYVYGTNGTVESVNVSLNNTVYFGSKLFTLADKPASSSYTEAVSSRTEKAEDLKKAYELRNNPVLLAPTDGVVASCNAAEGKPVTGDAFVLHTGGAAKMTVSVDELDIGVVSLGQHASVTLDAFSGESFDAEVTRISRLGTASGSITTYAVELTIQGDERFLEGMNGSAVITAQQKDDVLLIPVAAIYEDETGVYVYVQTADGAARHDVTTGLSDGTNAEITGGLAEGEVVRYQGAYVGIVDRYQQYGMMGRGGN